MNETSSNPASGLENFLDTEIDFNGVKRPLGGVLSELGKERERLLKKGETRLQKQGDSVDAQNFIQAAIVEIDKLETQRQKTPGLKTEREILQEEQAAIVKNIKAVKQEIRPDLQQIAVRLNDGDPKGIIAWAKDTVTRNIPGRKPPQFVHTEDTLFENLLSGDTALYVKRGFHNAIDAAALFYFDTFYYNNGTGEIVKTETGAVDRESGRLVKGKALDELAEKVQKDYRPGQTVSVPDPNAAPFAIPAGDDESSGGFSGPEGSTITVLSAKEVEARLAAEEAAQEKAKEGATQEADGDATQEAEEGATQEKAEKLLEELRKTFSANRNERDYNDDELAATLRLWKEHILPTGNGLGDEGVISVARDAGEPPSQFRVTYKDSKGRDKGWIRGSKRQMDFFGGAELNDEAIIAAVRSIALRGQGEGMELTDTGHPNNEKFRAKVYVYAKKMGVTVWGIKDLDQGLVDQTAAEVEEYLEKTRPGKDVPGGTIEPKRREFEPGPKPGAAEGPAYK